MKHTGVRVALLRSLASNGPGYGLELMERVLRETGGAVRLHGGNTYPSLRALEDAGLLTSWEEVAPDPAMRCGVPRRYYKITEAGRKAVEREAG